ncbi:hypothetical protein K7432_017266 [Basidiobolus ranarum]|uniref:Uncharacterized protein n=1 Tax=Basidiobolus ranarum TaxID=34480 RepID=A0ABR2VLD9_9FUNG
MTVSKESIQFFDTFQATLYTTDPDMTVSKVKMSKIIRQLDFTDNIILANYVMNKLRKIRDCVTSPKPTESDDSSLPAQSIEIAFQSIQNISNFEDVLTNGFLLDDQLRTPTLKLTLTPQLLR